jgi:hypothetical protein
MVKFEIVAGNLVLSNENGVLQVLPKDICACDIHDLTDKDFIGKKHRVWLYNKNLEKNTCMFEYPLELCTDAGGTVFTKETFTSFVKNNLGFYATTDLPPVVPICLENKVYEISGEKSITFAPLTLNSYSIFIDAGKAKIKEINETSFKEDGRGFNGGFNDDQSLLPNEIKITNETASSVTTISVLQICGYEAVIADVSDVYTITFETQGGSSIGAIQVEAGPTATLPTPNKVNNAFQGWYTEPNGAGTKYDDTTVIDSDITLYAYWMTTNVDVYGDSISTNYNGATSWINQLATEKGLTVTNYAVSGTGVKKALNTACSSMEENPTKDQYFFTGFNNTRVLVDNGQKACIKAAYRSMLSWLYMKQIEFPYGNPGSPLSSSVNSNYLISASIGYATSETLLSSYCSRTLKYRYGSNLSANFYVGQNNNTTSYLECTNLIGDNIVIGTWITNTVLQTDMEIVIDGVVVMTYNGNSKYVTIAADGSSNGWVNDAIIIRGLSDTNHTVRVNFKTAGKYGMIDYIGVLKNIDEDVRNANILAFPHMNSVGYSYTGYQTTEAILNAASADLKADVQLNFPDYPITFVDINAAGYYEPNTAGHVQADGIHPTTLGNNKIKDAVVVALY